MSWNTGTGVERDFVGKGLDSGILAGVGWGHIVPAVGGVLQGDQEWQHRVDNMLPEQEEQFKCKEQATVDNFRCGNKME